MKKVKKEKIIGILGGMGPYATIDIFKKIVDLTPAKKDWEHLRIIIDNNPKIPSRARCLLFNEKSPVDEMVKTAKNLEKAGVDFIIIPCNTSHYFFSQVASKIKTPIINMIDEVVKEVVLNYKNINKVGLLATEATCGVGIYQSAFAKKNITVLVLDDLGQKQTREIIESAKLNKITKDDKKKAKDLIDKLTDLGAQGVILGCTELPLVYKENNLPLPLLDSTLILAKAAVKKARQN